MQATLDSRMEPGEAAPGATCPSTATASRHWRPPCGRRWQLGHDRIGTGHLLVALTGAGLAGDVLGDLGVTADGASVAVAAAVAERGFDAG